MKKLKFLVLGAGYANLSLLKTLNKSYFKKAEFKLVSLEDYHYHTVLLHKTAAWGENVTFNLSTLLNRNIELVKDEVLELKKDEIVLKNGSIKDFDYVISGLGFSSESFGIKGINEYTSSIGSYKSALKINEEIMQKLKSYKENNDENNLKFIVCGGGLTGIEFASELAQSLKQSAEKENINSSKIKIFVIEAMPSILPMFSKKLVEKAYKRLDDLGIEVKNNAKILECFKGGIKIEGQPDLLANTIIWTAGVKGNEVISKSKDFTSIRSKIEINDSFQSLDSKFENYFFIGDNSCLKDKSTDRFYAPTAQLSVRQGQFLAKNIQKLIDGDKIEQGFNFSQKASFCSLGNDYAIGYIYKFEFSGKIASFLKHFIEQLWVKTLFKGV